MQKQKAIMKIESYSNKDGTLLLSVSDCGVRAMLKGVVELCERKHGGFIKLEMSPPYKARSTGDKSQNNLIWKLITEIALKTGNELEDVEIAAKERAVKRGYPCKMNKLTGGTVLASMATINTVEAGYLIEELYQIAAEFGIVLEE